MSLAASAILDIIASEFASDPNKTQYVTFATDRTSECQYGTQYQMAIALRAAHMMTLAGRGGGDNTGSISSKREGRLALSFGAVSAEVTKSDPDLSQTHYGLQLLGLRNGSVLAVGVTGGYMDGICNS